MKNKNLSTLVAVAVAVVFLSVPLKAYDKSVMGPQLAMAAKAGGFNTLMLESFGNDSGAGLDKVRYTEEELTPGLVKEKGLELMNSSQSGGTDCYQKAGSPRRIPKHARRPSPGTRCLQHRRPPC